MMHSEYILITGASGFAGGRIAHSIASTGFNVIAPVRTNSKIFLPHVNIIECTYSQPMLMFTHNVKHIIHCAALTSANSSNQELIYSTNIELAEIVADWISHFKPLSVLFLSTVSIYGDISVSTLKLDTPPRRPNAYGTSKLIAENIIKKIASQCNASLTILRLPGTIGYGSHGNIISNIIKSASCKDNFPIRLRNPHALFNNVLSICNLTTFAVKLIGSQYLQASFQMAIPASCKPVIFQDVVMKILQLLNQESLEVIWDDVVTHSFTIDISEAELIQFPTPATINSICDIINDVRSFTEAS